MKPELYPYQEEGAQFLASRKRALLADKMGLGKSAQAIRAADLVNAERIVVVCPAIARINWRREFEMFSRRERNSFVLSAKQQPPSSGLAICSYDYLTSNKSNISRLAAFAPQVVVLDESHFLKNAEAKRTRAAFSIPAEYEWALTGTPAPNNAIEIWPLLYAHGIYKGTQHEFAEQFCKWYDTPYGPKFTGHKNVPQLRALLADYMLRRNPEDVMSDLPPLRFGDIYVQEGEVDMETAFPMYFTGMKRDRDLEQDLGNQEARIASALRVGEVEALDKIVAQVASYRRLCGLKKVQSIADIVAAELEIDAYEKIVIFAHHRDVIVGLRDALAERFRPHGWQASSLFGQTPPEKRQMLIDGFNNNPKHRAIVCNIAAAGTAIRFKAANQVLFAEADWVPGNNLQAAMRCWWTGQKNSVFVRFAALPDSLDEHVQRVFAKKAKDLAEIFDA